MLNTALLLFAKTKFLLPYVASSLESWIVYVGPSIKAEVQISGQAVNSLSP